MHARCDPTLKKRNDMPYLPNADRQRTHYRFDGPADAPVLVLSNSLGTDLHMWDLQMPVFSESFRVLRYDTRGHGHSDVSAHPFGIADLAGDVMALLDGLAIERAHFCGLSMGGMIGMHLGISHALRLRSLILCNTAAYIGPADLWNARIQRVRHEGITAVTNAVLDRWFTKRFMESNPERVAPLQTTFESTSGEGYAACCAAVRDMDQRQSVDRITVPTLVISGSQDAATPPADGRFVADRISGARYVELDAAHLSNVEVPEDFTRSVLTFLAR
jgi:3-oxoadipate enol-lactonase